MSTFDTPVFSLEDVRTVRKDVSINIDDFDQYAVEAQRNYLSKLLGDKLYTALVDAPTDARMVTLLDGEVYQDGGRDVIYRGLTVYLSYVWLYLYAAGSNSSLTPIGAQRFIDELSESASDRKAARDNTDHFIKSADGMEEGILRYLDNKNTTYPEFDESIQIKQAQNDNIQFRTFGRSYRKNINNTM